MGGAVIFDVKEEGERATWRSLIHCKHPFHRLALIFCRFPLAFCHFFIYLFVVFLLSLIRERRGALLFALNEESAAKVIAADSSLLTIFLLIGA